MFEQQARGQPAPRSSSPLYPGEAVIFDWIDAWNPVREDVQQLLGAYAQADAGHDISSFTPLIEEIDAAMRLLRHRVDWLRSYLGHEPPPARDLD